MKHELAAEFVENTVEDEFIGICTQKSEIKAFMAQKKAFRE